MALSLVVVFLSKYLTDCYFGHCAIVLIVDTRIAVKGNVPTNSLINALPKTEALKALI